MRRLSCLFSALFFFAITYPAAARQLPHNPDPTRPYTVVYKLKPTGNARLAAPAAAKLKAALAKVGAREVHQKFPKAAPPANARVASGAVDLSLLYELTYAPGQSLQQVRRTLLSSGAVAYVEPVYQRQPLLQPNDPAADSTKATQYYLKLIQAYECWEIEQGNAAVLIGILDTGTRFTHQDLKEKVQYNEHDPLDGLDNDGDGYTDNYRGWDFADQDNDPSDDSQYKGHGTIVAGIAAAATNNGQGIAGTGFKSKFLPLKVFSSKSGNGFAGYEAIVYAADRGCKVINLSWGGEGHSQYEQDIINYAVLNKDVVVVASAGNTDKGAPLDVYPASYDNVLSVGGTTATDVKYAGFTYSYNIDLMAPGRDIVSLSANSDTQLSAGSSGTSFAAPMVSGAAALVRAHYPELNARQVMERLRVTTDDIYQLAGNKPYLEMLGKGRLNLKKALKTLNVKAVRCTSFSVADRQIPYAGATIDILADFLNYLAPVQNLQVELTSPSPYVSITRGTLNLGSLGTVAAADNGKQPFRVKIAGTAPANSNIAFRLGFKDGTYTDFQYFTIAVNPDFVTLDANNLKVTINSMGNLGYNGLNMAQGDGVTYKNGNSLLFEGGLMVATDATHVSDNIRNEVYQSDGDFTRTSTARLHSNTPLASQEARAVMHDAYPSDKNVGIQVKHVAYAWKDAAAQDYVILEYHIRNITTAPIEKLYAGVFADWDIGDNTANIADWDEANKLGYVYSTTEGMPYTGMTLLTPGEPAYYAIDNVGGGATTFAIEDGFTSSEKYKVLSGGVARTKANGGGPGNNVSQVVGSATLALAPGETRVVAFALLTADNLKVLQQQAAAARLKYRTMKTGPVPVALADTACSGSTPVWRPKNGSSFNFYADPEKSKLLGAGASYTLPALAGQATIYAANADSLFESAAVPAIFSLPTPALPAFELSKPDVAPGQPVSFLNKSINSRNWRWSINNAAPVTTKDLTYTFPAEGTYEIKLTVSDRFGCADTSVTQVLEIKNIVPTALPEELAQQIKVYPNPTHGFVRIQTKELTKGKGHPQVTLVDVTGRTLAPSFRQSADETELDLTTLADGVYLLHITYHDLTLTKRLVLLRP